MKPRNLYNIADAFGRYFDQPPIERVDPINNYPRSFSAETLKFAEQCAREYPELAVREDE